MTIAMTRPAARPRATPARHATPRAELAARRRHAQYRRRRAVAGVLVAVTVGSAAMVADSVLTGPGGVPASAAGAGTAPPRGHGRVVRAAAGDSLWSIAAEHRGDVPITRYVDKLISLNGGTAIEVGQFVRLP